MYTLRRIASLSLLVGKLELPAYISDDFPDWWGLEIVLPEPTIQYLTVSVYIVVLDPAS